MDLQKITDLKELKALAYDAIADKELAESNLRAINRRIMELQNQPKEEKPKKP